MPPRVAIQAPAPSSFAIDDAGRSTLVAERENGEIDAVTSVDGISWGAPVALGDVGSTEPAYRSDRCAHPLIAMDGRGAAVVVWGGTAFRAARRPAGSETWEQPMTVRPIPACFGRDLAVDPMGNGVAVWNSRGQVGYSELYAAVLDSTPPILQRLVIPHDGGAWSGASTRAKARANVLTSSSRESPLTTADFLTTGASTADVDE